MPDTNVILSAIRQELVNAGLVRRPGTAGAAPPMVLEPVEGAPAPGELDGVENDATLIVTLRLSGDLAEGPLDTYRRRTVVDVVYRSKTTAGLQRARTLDAAIRRRLVPHDQLGEARTIGAGGATPLDVLSIQLFAGLGRVSSSAAAGYTDRAAYAVEVLA